MHGSIPFSKFGNKLRLNNFLGALGICILFSCFTFVVFSIQQNKDKIIFDETDQIIQVQKIRFAFLNTVVSSRGYLVSRDPLFLEFLEQHKLEFLNAINFLKNQPNTGAYLLTGALEATAQYNNYLTLIDQFRNKDENSQVRLRQDFETILRPQKVKLEQLIDELLNRTTAELNSVRLDSLAHTQKLTRIMILVGLISIASMIATSSILTNQAGALFKKIARQKQIREDMVAIVSHDLRNPLSTIQMALPIVKEENLQLANTKTMNDCIQIIEHSTNHMAVIVNDLVDAAKFEAGQISISKSVLEVQTLIENCSKQFKTLLKSKEMVFQVTHHCTGVYILADKDYLERAISNLISNAEKFTPCGGLIRLSAESNREFVTIKVTDSGMGIPPDRMTTIFERYSQLDSSDRRGAGLGLYIVKKIVDAHGADISVDSTIGKGSVFSIRIKQMLDSTSS